MTEEVCRVPKTVIVGGGAAGLGAAGGVKAADPGNEVVVYTQFEDVAYSPCGIPYVHAKEIPTFEALFLALIGGVGLAIVLVQSKWVELALFPFAVILQVTPIVAIAPLLLIYAPNTQTALLIVAFLVAFFPILSNMVQGLKSVDHNLLNLFDLYGAGRWQQLIYLKIPASMPYFMTGLRIGGGLSLIAAVVAEFAAGSAGAGSGLAFRLLESGYRLNMPRLYAALILMTFTGVAIFGVTSFISWLVLHRWHESAVRREN